MLESLMGRLNHVTCIFLPMHHFMGRLYQALYRAKARSGWTSLSPNELLDLSLHLEFLQYANRGLSLNNVAFRKPTQIYRYNASEFGIGGYSIISGRAWCWEIPVHLRLWTPINSLEFISSVITIWVDILEGIILPEDCLLSQTDNSTAAGWLCKSNFVDGQDENTQLSTASKLAAMTIESQCCIFSQWFLGDENNISDSLPRDFHLDDTHLANLLSAAFPNQVPFGLVIHQLPTEISYWVTSQLLLLLQTMLWSKEPTRSSFARGVATNNTSCPLGFETTSTWTTLTEVNATRFSVPSLSQSEKVDTVL